MQRLLISHNIFFLVIVLITLFFEQRFLFPQNDMELIIELTGEHERSQYGNIIESLDFNGDGYDDLVVGSARWDPEYPG